jgi:ubiquinol-cytochrome c reductase cytochrome c subunit
MCHNFAGSGGALTQGKYAPSLKGVTPEHIYEAMLTGPQNMPVFNDAQISPENKQDIIKYLKMIESEPAPTRSLGSIGPVAEGLFGWIVGIGLLAASAVWLAQKAK